MNPPPLLPLPPISFQISVSSSLSARCQALHTRLWVRILLNFNFNFLNIAPLSLFNNSIDPPGSTTFCIYKHHPLNSSIILSSITILFPIIMSYCVLLHPFYENTLYLNVEFRTPTLSLTGFYDGHAVSSAQELDAYSFQRNIYVSFSYYHRFFTSPNHSFSTAWLFPCFAKSTSRR